MIDKYVAQAPTQAQAVQKGLEALGITRDEAEIIVQEPGKKGFLGIGQRDAVVIVERKEKKDLVSDILDPISSINHVEEKETEEHSEKTNVPEEVEEIEEVEIEDTSNDKFESTMNEEVEPITKDVDPQVQDQEAIENISVYLTNIIRAMNVDDVEVFISRVDNLITYDIETESAGLVIGRHGKVLNGLQTLAQNHMHQLAHSKFFVKVDAEKYRERRKSTVEKLADRTAKKVVQTGKKVSLNPMPAHERKQIHRYLNQYTGVQTYSEGREPYRYLVVEPLDDEE